jgi:hypothetical protein
MTPIDRAAIISALAPARRVSASDFPEFSDFH